MVPWVHSRLWSGTIALTMFQKFTRPQWLLTGGVILIALAVVVGLKWYMPTVRAPPEYPDANLQVDVFVRNRDGIPVRGFLIDGAGLSCPTFDGAAVITPPAWAEWCKIVPDELGRPDVRGGRPLNIPTQTDGDGTAVLWFSVYPRPHRAGLRWGDTPNIGITLTEGWWRAFEPDITAPDHWRVGVTLDQ